ncbi:hypothetical protein FM106_08410 [Brachybacterium faecium]|nr:hypothetical protein FM106_08410 [Brachybacterium faecium]
MTESQARWTTHQGSGAGTAAKAARNGRSDGRHTAQGPTIHKIADGRKGRGRDQPIRVGRYMPGAGVLPVRPCLSGSTGPAVSSHRAHATGTAPYAKKNGGKSARSQAGGADRGVSRPLAGAGRTSLWRCGPP